MPYGSINADLVVGTNGNRISPENTFGFRNRIINGAMVIDQRNAVVTTSGAYIVDRFANTQSGGGIISLAKSTTAPTGFTSSLSGTVTTPDSSIAAGDIYRLYQYIEGYNCADFGFGTASASTITVSFWVRSSIIGTYCLGLQNASFNRGYAANYTINTANTWEYKTVTIAGDTTGTWATDNTAGIAVFWDLGSGTTWNQTANTWAATNTWKTSSQTNWISTNGATFYITGVQLEVGSNATSFEYRPYGTELQLCYRYYRRYTGAGTMVGVGSFLNTTNAYRWGFNLDIPMRVTPTVLLNTSQGWGGNSLGGTATIATSYSTTNVIDCDVSLSSAMGAATAQTVFKVYMGGASPFIELSGAEL